MTAFGVNAKSSERLIAQEHSLEESWLQKDSTAGRYWDVRKPA